MQTLNELKSLIDSNQSIKLITQALGDVATFKLRSTRKTVEQNIKFFQEIASIYRLVKYIAIKSGRYSKLKKAKPGQTICVLLTSNEHFYGGLDSVLTKFYIQDSAKLNCDRIVVGKTGQDFLASSFLSRDFKYESVIFKKDFPLLDELKILSTKVFDYTRILVYHTKFITLLSSKPSVSDISASDIESLKPDKKTPLFFILEPELEKIVEFFENQIVTLLFQAIFLEVDIARQAGRMIAMNQAQENANKQFQLYNKQILKAKKEITNLQILETYAGIIGK